MTALAEEAVGMSRAGLAERSAAISRNYRDFQASSRHLAGTEDVLAYAIGRLPATYAAVAAVLEKAGQCLPEFSPTTLLDAGAGPGTASWAAVAEWPEIARVTMVDHGADFRGLARRLSAASLDGALRDAEIGAGDIRRLDLASRRFDLVVASYALTELADDAYLEAVEQLWLHCGGALVLIEPGRPRDYRRLLLARGWLLDRGATMVAPCPHANVCPLPPDDWCHFSTRLPRSRDHMLVKGATVPFEDEKFSYMVLARAELAMERAHARIIAPPERNKFAITLPLCTPVGLERETVMKRDAENFGVARKREWGDAWR
ncbi:MAG TPA: small ribosomal subunit Rsm22 family protein [Devosiaceae bacterium]|jgi:ribosomal protein RSM22 (predicted rRNA methylase)